LKFLAELIDVQPQLHKERKEKDSLNALLFAFFAIFLDRHSLGDVCCG
jgi:hypothetical protein